MDLNGPAPADIPSDEDPILYDTPLSVPASKKGPKRKRQSDGVDSSPLRKKAKRVAAAEDLKKDGPKAGPKARAVSKATKAKGSKLSDEKVHLSDDDSIMHDDPVDEQESTGDLLVDSVPQSSPPLPPTKPRRRMRLEDLTLSEKQARIRAQQENEDAEDQLPVRPSRFAQFPSSGGESGAPNFLAVNRPELGLNPRRLDGHPNDQTDDDSATMVPTTETSDRERSVSTVSDLDDHPSASDPAVFSNMGGASDEYEEKGYDDELGEPEYDPDGKLIRLARPTTPDQATSTSDESGYGKPGSKGDLMSQKTKLRAGKDKAGSVVSESPRRDSEDDSELDDSEESPSKAGGTQDKHGNQPATKKGSGWSKKLKGYFN